MKKPAIFWTNAETAGAYCSWRGRFAAMISSCVQSYLRACLSIDWYRRAIGRAKRASLICLFATRLARRSRLVDHHERKDAMTWKPEIILVSETGAMSMPIREHTDV